MLRADVRYKNALKMLSRFLINIGAYGAKNLCLRPKKQTINNV